ncbi:CPCC family cysteine-rich protein [Streptomyces zhihengii]|uniref:CPCC family cysteine-rich protein n=1 Tax=Streptomyces zhihengii TaxID=1818004 RepID=UPI0027DC1BD6|nr:CPCC family cysteine-rich protein [Streptomyces zhihengii]
MTLTIPCVCCGHLTLSEPPGSYEICPVCFWEDDRVQLRWPDWTGGANRPSLIEAQVNFTDFGAC